MSTRGRKRVSAPQVGGSVESDTDDSRNDSDARDEGGVSDEANPFEDVAKQFLNIKLKASPDAGEAAICHSFVRHSESLKSTRAICHGLLDPVADLLGVNIEGALAPAGIDKMPVGELRGFNDMVWRRFVKAKGKVAVYSADPRPKAATTVKMSIALAKAVAARCFT